MEKKRLALFVSGTGSNAKNIISYFEGNEAFEVVLVMTNKSDSPIIEFTLSKSINLVMCSNEQAMNADFLSTMCSAHSVTHVILAGYLKLIPAAFIAKYPNKIINIHPALLPNYGGKGMYGDNVHKAVLENKEAQTGITIHEVNEHFDEGRFLAQFHCKIDRDETLDSLKAKIQYLEHSFFPVVIEKTLLAE
jgi:phosphoribosylglycinamide formyltransferase-1